MNLNAFTRIFLRLVRNNLISIIGLMAGMIVTIFSVNYIVFENSFDSFHKNARRIYHVSTQMTTQSGEDAFLSRTHFQLKEFVDEQIPQVERSCRIRKTDEVIHRGQEKFKGHHGLYVDGDFFEIFDFTGSAGVSSCMEKPGQVILTRSLARKLFGSEDCVGRELVHANISYSVCSIVKDPPANTNLKFDYLLPIKHFIDSLDRTDDQVSVETYILTREKLPDPKTLSATLNLFFANYGIGFGDTYQFQINSIIGTGPLSGDRSSNYFLLIGVTLLVMLVSIVNFSNGFAAECETRRRQIGIRKIMGASRVVLVRSMLLQSILMSVISSVGSLLLVSIFMSPYRIFSGQDITLYGPGLWKIQFIVIAIALLVGLLGGLYPGIKYTSHVHINVSWDKKMLNRGILRFSKIMVLTQLIVSGSLLAILILFLGQMRFLSLKDPGYETQDRILVRVGGPLVSSFERYIEELRSIPSVISVSGSIIEFGGTIALGIKKGDDSDYQHAAGFIVEDGFFKTYGIGLVSGITFEESSGRDAQNVIIDQSTAQLLDLDQPVGSDVFVAGREMRVIGMVEDADLIAMRGEREPSVYTQLTDQCDELIIHYRGNALAVAKEIENQLSAFDPAFEFNYRTLEEARNQLYSDDRKQVQMILIVVTIAVLITMGGAYTMTRYQVGLRAKEISVRKILGASLRQLIKLIVTEMVWMIGIAYLVATPIAYLFTQKWLQNFTHRVHIGPRSFILALLLLSALILITVLAKVLQAARMNPVEKIRND